MDSDLNAIVETSNWSDWLRSELESWDDKGLTRRLRAFEATSPVHGRIGQRELVLFSSNDYLGLSFHPEVREAAAEAVRDHGMGPRGSALVCGYTTLHEELESRLARLKRTESALLFPTGFAANLAVLQSLCDSDTTVFSDEFNHASIVDGCRMAKRSGARLEVFRHADPNHLEDLMRSSKAPRKLIVTDSVFSMDGDLAPLREIVDLKERYGALLVVDEAHATLLFGDRGAGLSEHLGVEDRVDIHVGTLSKAFGAQGGFVATTADIRNWLLNRGRAYVFSTALPIPIVAAALASLDVVKKDSALRSKLWRSVDRVSEELGVSMCSPILPIRLGDNDTAMSTSEALFEKGFHVPAIRPPTVPEGSARLRIALSAAHGEEDLKGLVSALRELVTVS